jgi:tetratricopeptide (TPR) repeat protein
MKRICTGFMLALGLTITQAQAQQKNNEPTEIQMEQAKALFAKGEDHFKLGEFEKALEAYKESYKLSHAPLLLLNMGQCQVKLEQYEEAKHSYEALLREDPNTLYRVEVEGKIIDMDRLIAEEQAKQEATSQAMLAASQPIIIETPTRRKGLMIGGIAGGVLLGGSALTLFLLTRNDEELPPPIPIPGSQIGNFVSF